MGTSPLDLAFHEAVEHPKNIPEETRTLVFERDGYQCQACGSIRNLHLHHWLHFRSAGGGHDDWNLVTVCWTCHDLIHAHQIDIELHWVLGRWHAFVTRRK